MPDLILEPWRLRPADERECTEECASHEGGDCDCQTDDEPDFDVGGGATMTSRLPTNKELGIKPTKKDHALADEIVLSGHMKIPATWQSSLEPFAENPDSLVVKDGDDRKALRFVECGGAQKCSDCWFEWFDTHLCQTAPCNSQGRTDGRAGTWQEPERVAR